MATLEELSPSVPYIIQSSFATRLAEAKKVAIEAALKERQESLKAVALKLQTLPDPSVLVGQSGGNEGVKVDQNPTIPFRLSAPYSLKSAGKRKRPTGEDNTSPRRTSASAKSPKQEDTPPVMMQTIQTRTTRHLSTWYDSIDMKSKFSRADLESLRYTITLIGKCSKAVDDVKGGLFSELRTRLHRMEFYDFLSGVLVRKSRILETEGLPAIFEASASASAGFPWDIRADSRMLYQRWVVGQLDPHLLRGLEDKKITKSDGTIVKSRRFASDYNGRVSPNYVGEGNLTNGMWWPLQFCAMRDGAHGETEAGIHGQIGYGAYSIVVSEGGYRNVDGGTRLEYCGTSGAIEEPSKGTKLLKESFTLKNPIRVLRSSSLASSNPYRPTKGLRYDGLYEITGFEILDIGTAMHRFSLQRCEGQDPIRYQGVEARPSNEELAAYAKIRKLLGFAT